MGTGPLSYEPFEISLQGSSVIVTPLRYVARDSFPVPANVNHQIFESKSADLASCLRNDVVVLARYQESESRAKKWICIERISSTLFSAIYGLVTAANINDVPEVDVTGRLIQFEDERLPDFSSHDWWGPINQEQRPKHPIAGARMQLDLGKQPSENVLDKSDSVPTFEELMDDFRTTFHKCLYLSKASLVFFVKSTLPKLRQRLAEYDYSTSDYSAYIQAALIPALTELDLKYKKTMPMFINSELLGQTQPEHTLFPVEGKAVRGWIDLCRQTMKHPTAELIISKELSSIKTREYQMLILLHLEVITIQQGSREDSFGLESGAMLVCGELSQVIDVLIDRLGILQSLDFLKNEDPLKVFCLEVIQPFYSTRIPEITSAIYQKCVPHDLLAYEVPPTPYKARKDKKKTKDQVKSSTTNSAVLKRTRSAPADLLPEKRPAFKKRSLGREVSMSKRAPSFEVSQARAPVMKKTMSFEDKRRQKVELEEQERVQVGQTPAKSRVQDFNDRRVDSNLVGHLSIASDSKASFMAIGETPAKVYSMANVNITETPNGLTSTPTRTYNRVFTAPADGVHDTPTGRSILFKLDSPSRPIDHDPVTTLDMAYASPAKAGIDRHLPVLRKSVTFGGFDEFVNGPTRTSAKNVSENIFEVFEKDVTDVLPTSSHKNLFGSEIVARRKSLSATLEARTAISGQKTGGTSDENDASKTKPTILKDVLDWL